MANNSDVAFLLLFSIFDFTTAGDWDFVAAVGRIPAVHCEDLIFLSFEIMGFIV